MGKQAFGSIGWVDLTVPAAKQLQEFYQKVAGWKSVPVSMGKHDDFTMHSASGEAVAGICHALGSNANLPPVWLIYIVVENLDLALQHCRDTGGEVVSPVRMAGGSKFAVIKDPAGAHVALWEPAEAA